MKFSLSTTPLFSTALREHFVSNQAGAFVSFEGWVRDHNNGQSVVGLEYEAMASVCEKESKKIFEEVKNQFDIIDVECVHRTGALKIGDMAVWVGVLAAHRDDAFKACRYIIDEVKHRLPIWKKEFYTGGDSGWINCEGTHDIKTNHLH